LARCQHGAAHLAKKLGVGFEQSCIKPETIGITDGGALAAKRLVVHYSLRKYKCNYIIGLTGKKTKTSSIEKTTVTGSFIKTDLIAGKSCTPMSMGRFTSFVKCLKSVKYHLELTYPGNIGVLSENLAEQLEGPGAIGARPPFIKTHMRPDF
jgi:hypothetical protein